jgi:hypothetical protein
LGKTKKKKKNSEHMQKSAKSQKENTHRYREVFPSIRKNAPITQTQKKKEPHAPPPLKKIQQ